MNTITDLRESLEQTAHRYDAPDPHELLRGVQDDIATGRDRGSRTPRLVAAAAAVALVAAGGWALSQGLGEEETGTMHPANTWELVDGNPPEYAAGLALVETVELGASEDGVVILDPEPLVGPSYAVAWCTGASEGAPSLVVGVGPADEPDSGVPIGCLTPQAPEVMTPMPLPELSGDIGINRLPEDAAQDAAGPGTATTVVVGLYREASTSEFPYPDQTEPTEPPTADVVLDAGTPATTEVHLDHLGEAAEGYLMPAVSVPTREGTVLTTWAGEPGRLLVAVNGMVITNDGEGLAQPASAGPWQHADPDLRGGYWLTWTASASTREFDLSPSGLAAHGIQVSEGETVTVAARAAFPRDAWQVGIDQPAGGPDAGGTSGPAPVEPTEALPALAYGYEQVTAVSVPASGSTFEIELGDVDPDHLIWVTECSAEAALVDVRIGSTPVQCSPGMEWLNVARVPGLVEGQPVDVTVGVGPEPVTLAAYTPRVWEDYPFEESADPIGTSDSAEAVLPRPVDGERPSELTRMPGPAVVYREVATVSTSDLDADGRAEVTVPSSTDLSIWIESTGVSRMRLALDGTPVEQLVPDPDESVITGILPAHQLLLRDGWFSTWTAESRGQQVRFDHADGRTGHGERDEPTVTIEVETVDGAEVELTFFELVPEDNG
ncbi:hypothetical protein MWU75_05575 [Ornithinimicrobium sp. F0845]|uniref:hypothetical protein n=1 Tax=Ornithinimicrobium sp. F0845 TaxID=2926412 RepID=UPI001FF4D279|nr:hypothetical protein [Ornithinimicrobium sp. F0845]MCK0111606.1 hypothetical protein [Ornithinimicrobium sp. F0845]